MAESTASNTESAYPGTFFADLMAASRKKLLDLSLRNRLLSFPPADPEHRDDKRAHKYLMLNGHLRAVWSKLIDEEKQIRVSAFNPDELANKLKKLSELLRKSEGRGESELIRVQIKETAAEIADGEAMAAEGHVWVKNLENEAYQKRLRRLKDEAKSLEDTTGDSAFFLAIGFLKWRERELRSRVADPSKDGGRNPKVDKFAPLILVKVSLTDEGKGAAGRKKFRIVPEDPAQDNQSLKAKLKEEWGFNLPDLGEETKASDYLAAVKRAITLSKIEGFEVIDSIALGFFNFARYRLWLDLDPKQWKGQAPENHPIVRSILSVNPHDTSCPPIIDATRDEALADEVARHQEKEDIPIIRDADTSQYSALLYARKGKSIVIIGPPGSGKSQTITNLVATSIANGKKVLFVAQKLPALDVVASRIRESGLGEFCLQFYSTTRDGVTDRKPVSPIEIHQQLTASRNLLGDNSRDEETDWRGPRGPGLAKKLNAYATHIHAIHPVYGEPVQRILCQGLKLKEEASLAWGEDWNEALLTITLPEGKTISPEWVETRSRVLSDIAHLRHEAGDFWAGWTPYKLTILEQPQVERALESYRRALKSLMLWCEAIDARLREWDGSIFTRLAKQSEKLVCPKKCGDEFIRSILGDEDIMRRAHEFERELKASEECLREGEAVLLVLPEGVQYTATFASSHLAEIEQCVEQNGTYGEARENIGKLLSLLQVTDELVESMPLYPSGLVAYTGKAEEARISLLIALAQQEDGNYRRAPALLLPALARRLSVDSNLADESMLISDKVDELTTAKSAATAVFAQTLRAEKLITTEFVAALKLACSVGLESVVCETTENHEEVYREVTKAASMVLAAASDILASVKDSSGELLNRCTHQVGRAHSVLSAGSLRPPQSVEVGLVDAWAKGIINEAEAKAAATSHERAVAISTQLAGIISRVEADEQLAQLFEKSAASSVALGLTESPVEAVKKLRPTLTEFEQASGSLLGFIRRFAKLANQGTFSELSEANRLVDLIQPSVKLTGAKLDGLCDAEAVASLRSAAVDLISRRAALVPGARSILESARGLIRGCLIAAQVAEEASGNLLAIRRPTTLREFRVIGATLPILRSMPSLPIGCDVIQMAGEQHAATIRMLFSTAKHLEDRAKAFSSDVVLSAVVNSTEGRSNLNGYREKQSSVFRLLQSRWRSSRAAIKGFAPTASCSDALKQYEQACELRSDEEFFAADLSGAAVLGSYFRGVKTDWKWFSPYAAWVEKLSSALDGFEINEKVVSAWKNEKGSIDSISNACAHLERSFSEAKADFPDLFEGADAVFSEDVAIASARGRASALLGKIDSLLASQSLGLGEVRATIKGSTVTALIRELSDLEESVGGALPTAKRVMGDSFDGSPASWATAVDTCEWAARLKATPAFEGSVKALMVVCISEPESLVQVSRSGTVSCSALNFLEQQLHSSKVRPEEAQGVQDFIDRISSLLETLNPGVSLLNCGQTQTVGALSDAGRLMKELVLESTRAERFKNAIAPSVPSSASVEVSMAWSLGLEKQGLPKSLVAFLASSPHRVEEVAGFLSTVHKWLEAVEWTRTLSARSAPWIDAETTVAVGAQAAKTVAEGLSDARKRVQDCSARSGCTLGELTHASSAILKSLQLGQLTPAWADVLGCDAFASENPGLAIRETIFWVESLHTDRVPSDVLSWIVESESDKRIQWWAGLVRNSKKWRARRAGIRQSALPEFDDGTVLLNWRAALGGKHAALTLALEQLSRTVKNPDTAISKLFQATKALSQSSQAKTRAEQLRAGINGANLIGDSGSAIENRCFADVVAGLPIEVSPWALRVGAESASRHLSSLPQLLNDAIQERSRLKETMITFGACRGDGPSGILGVSLSAQAALQGIESSIAQIPGLSAWASLHREIKRTGRLGVELMAEEIVLRKATPELAVLSFNAAVSWQKAKVVWNDNPDLERFRSSHHQDLREAFSAADREAVKSQNQRRIVSALRRTTEGGAASWGTGGVDQILRHEASKRRKLVPVRKLVDQAGKRMQELCPCWFATPAAVAQFMAPGAADFDVVIMDEASQVTPEDAWGAIARGKQVIVVGDPKQMPPSNFFANASHDDDEEDEELPVAENGGKQFNLPKGHQQESVLKAAEASLPQVWLNWHYRSLHHGLIAPANFLSYDRRLVLFPSSHINHRHLGVRHTYIENGVATTGQVTNSVEAGVVVEHLVKL